MTTYNITGGGGITLKVTYSDPAGGFGGWFLHVVHGDGLADGDCSDNASALNAQVTFTSGSGSRPYYGSIASGNTLYRYPLLDSVSKRLERMFGSDAVVKWSAELVEAVTPATIDLDCAT